MKLKVHERLKHTFKIVGKSKLFFTFLLCLAFSKSLFSQEYVPMLDNTSWNVAVASFMGITNHYIDEGDAVVIGPYTYKKFIDTTIGDAEILLREDTAARKVYRRVNNTDELLFDFSLQINDPVTLPNGLGYVVMAIDNVEVNGGTRKRFFLNNFITSETWIEGVGCTRHPLKFAYEMPSDPYIYLTCSFDDGVNVYNYGQLNGGTPTDCGSLGVGENVLQKMVIFPNPVQSDFTLSSDLFLINATLTLYNSLGQAVKHFDNLNGDQILLNKGALKSGVYFTQLSQSGKIVAKNKLVID